MSDARQQGSIPTAASLDPRPPAAGEVPALFAVSALVISVTGFVYKSIVALRQYQLGRPDDALGWLWYGLTPPGFLASTLLFAGGIGILADRRWGARLMRTYAVLALTLVALGTIVRLGGVGTFVERQRPLAEAQQDMQMPASAGYIAVPIMLLFGAAACVYPLLILWHVRVPARGSGE